MDLNTRYDCIARKAPPGLIPRYPFPSHTAPEFKPRAKPKPRNPPTRPSHLAASRYFATHPLVKIACQLPRKLKPYQPRQRPLELATMSHEELKTRFLGTLIRVKWNHRTV